MLTDQETNLAFVSDRLEPSLPALVDRLRATLDGHGIVLRELRGTRDVWCRDYMPVQVGEGEFVRFRYAPDYLRGYEHLITAPSDVEPIPEIERCGASEIVLDGGNVVRRDGRCIVTDKIFGENPGLGRADLLELLRGLLKVDDVIVIPKEPYDVIGHADGVIRFLDDGLVVINDYSEAAPWYRRRLTSILRRAGLEWIELPYRPEESRSGGIPSAVGCHANFLMMRGLVVVPTYGRREDEIACRIIEKNTNGTAIVPLDCLDLAREGGVLNCVTWTIAVGRHSRQ